MKGRFLATSELVIIVIMACIPLFVTFPYRVNIFLSWEGAYRMSEGQVPFRDFGTPLGGMYWVIPAVFFKIFGPQLITLVKAQVFINIIAGLAFRSILKSLSLLSGIRFISVCLFCLSYSFLNFWPWYNHTVIVYELIALAFIFRFFLTPGSHKFSYWWLFAAAAFVCFSFFTKQDGGGMAFVICCVLIAYNSWANRTWRPFLLFIGSFVLIICLFILPLSRYGFGYWFNHGQQPHTARVSSGEIISEFLYGSAWIKFYLFLILLLMVARFKKLNELLSDRTEMLFLLLTLGVLGEAAVFQVTSYTPPDNNIFFHSFVVAFILMQVSKISLVNFEKPSIVAACLIGVLIWWSGGYWKYIQRVLDRISPPAQVANTGVSPTGENLVNKNTYTIQSPALQNEISVEKWEFSGLKSFDKIYMPKPTVEGIHRLLNNNLVRSGKELNVLNMSELTPLAVEMPYQLESNPELPLWHHLGVGMFNRQAAIYEKRIADHHYDLILFEYIPTLNNFYPFRVRDSLKIHYKIIDSFPAPRRGETMGNIEIYVKP